MTTALQKIRAYGDLVKFEHTIFALPFALAAMLLACPPGEWPTLTTVLCILGAMVGGRTFAMGLNRIIDAQIDAGNPRTQTRPIQTGRVKLTEAWGLSVMALLLMIVSVLPLPVLCLKLLPLAVTVLVIYSFVKRFSSLAHFVLGFALGCSAVGGWVAVTGELTLLPVIFGLAVVLWVAGFDVIYACQDVEFDRQTGLFSMPVVLGITGALRLSRALHLLKILCLLIFGVMYPHTGLGYWAAVVMTAGMLFYEHRLILPPTNPSSGLRLPSPPRGEGAASQGNNLVDAEINLDKVNEAFFTINGRISLMIFILVLLDKLFITAGAG